MPAKLDRAEALIARMSAQSGEPTTTATAVAATAVSLQGELDCLRAYECYWKNDLPRLLFHGHRALETTPVDWWSVRLLARLLLTGVFQKMGDEKRAYAVVYDAMKEEPRQDDHFQARLLISVSFVHLSYADLDGLMQVASQGLALSDRLNQPETTPWAHYMIGVVHYCRNELSDAEGHFTTVLSQHYLANAQCSVQSMFALALTYEAQGRSNKARETADLAVTFALEVSNPILLSAARVFQAELAVRQGRVADAGRWLDQFPPDAMTPTLFFTAVWTTSAKVLLASGTAEGRHAAAVELSLLRGDAESAHNPRTLIEVLALQSLLLDAQGDREAALDALTRAVILAQPSRNLRIFVDLGPQIGNLLNQVHGVHSRGVATAFVAEVLAALVQAKPVAAAMVRQDGLFEPLTERELQVLTLLAQRLSDKEIAAKLIISAGTVKRHTHSIYEKIHVRSRREAVAKAESLGLLSLRAHLS
jgi:LuxR family maltose regulon positive regulatory protein